MTNNTYINHILFRNSEQIGDTVIVHRFRQVKFRWSNEGLIIGSNCSNLVIKVNDQDIRCTHTAIPWSILQGKWSIRFIDSTEFAEGWIEEINSLEKWLEYIPFISSPDSLYWIDTFLHRKNAVAPITWKEYMNLIEKVESKYGRDAIELRKDSWYRYGLNAAIGEMTHSNPEPDSVVWLKEYFD